MINIAERPQEADDRAVPGHWEGDLMIGTANKSAIGTLVERSSGYAMLVHLPDGYQPEHVAPALAAKISTLPETLRRSLTWDQGPEMRDWNKSGSTPGSRSTSATPTLPDNAPPTRTPTDCYASTSRKAPTSPPSPSSSSTRSPTSSTTARKRLGFYKPTERLAELLLRCPPGQRTALARPESGAIGGTS